MLFEGGDISLSQERFAPSVPVMAEWQGRRAHIDFLIDTGTESTTLFPRQAHDLFGDALDQLGFEDAERRILIGDIGGTFHAAIEATIELTFHDDVDAQTTLAARILVIRPDPGEGSDGRGNFDTPSLLGRDLLLHFDLHVSGARGEVYLSLPD